MKIVKQLFVIISFLFIIGCSGNEIVNRDTVINNHKIIFSEEINANIKSDDLKSIESIEVLEQYINSSNKYINPNSSNYTLNSNKTDYKDILKYTIDIRLNDSVMNLTDVELQEVLENIPISHYPINYWYDENSKKRYKYEVQSYDVYVKDDLFKLEKSTIYKNGQEFNPKNEYLAEIREKESNRRYDVVFKIGGDRYIMKNATKSEINSKHSRIWRKRKRNYMGHPDVGPKNKDLLHPSLDWSKDVEIKRVYE